MSDNDQRLELSAEEIQWIKDEISDEKARSRMAKAVRNWLTFAMLLLASFSLFYDSLKQFVVHLVKG